jgi:putative transposase
MILPKLGTANTINGALRRWRRADLWRRGMDTLRQWERPSQRWLPAPSVCWADSPRSTTATPAEDVGFAGPKNIKGRKRPSLVETLGLMVAVAVTAASPDARLGWVALVPLYCAAGVTGFRHIWVEVGDDAQWRRDWGRRLQQRHKMAREVVAHTGQGSQVVKHRWKMERTLAWLLNDRRHSRDYERLTVRSEAMIQMSMIRRFLKRLA